MNRPRAQLAVVRLLTTSTGNLALVGSWLREVQQLSESGRAGVMQSGTQRHFRGFQISLARLTAIGENPSQKHANFPRDLLLEVSGTAMPEPLGRSTP